MAKEKSISGLIDRKIVAVSPQTSVETARELAKRSGVGTLPVLSHGKLVGIVNNDHLKESIDGKIEKIMKKPVFAEKDSDVKKARKMIINNGLERLPIVESKSSMICIGTVSSTDLI